LICALKTWQTDGKPIPDGSDHNGSPNAPCRHADPDPTGLWHDASTYFSAVQGHVPSESQLAALHSAESAD